MTKEIINLKDYFVHHYDDWGRLYCVEFKGSPLELENSIKCLEQENEKLKKEVKQIGSAFIKKGDYARELEQKNKELLQMLLEIRSITESATAKQQ